ncbi:hypothetical protein GPECTOR_58g546 [Gonium pectorale]|uniref:phytol kinase n=1 Tax=Gonium pectorale TaxID=33097 RepID=A0A150G5H4_GONPE|nr:hypothetical protein GPECTOR_58g546 [Gonium pectorale]|eukprot:KXZ45097.1 hypothetical protein GPECTOR_58g546 [Gonium pectorale]
MSQLCTGIAKLSTGAFVLLAADAGPPAAEAGGEPDGEALALHQGRRQVLVAVTSIFLRFTYGVLDTFVFAQWRVEPGPPLRTTVFQPLLAELAGALESSRVLEHAARVVLPLVLLLGDAHSPPSPEVEEALSLFMPMHKNLFTLASVLVHPSNIDAASAAEGARLLRALHGPCVTHAMLCFGLSTLVAADGGSSYGVEELARSPAVLAAAGEYFKVRGSGSGASAAAGPGRDTLMRLLQLFGAASEPPAERSCRRGVFWIAVRAGRLDVTASAAAAQERGNGPSPMPSAVPRNALGLVALMAFKVAATQLYAPMPSGRWLAATDGGAEVELWRLGVSSIRRALSGLPEAELRDHCRSFERVWSMAARGDGQAACADLLSLPPSPPRPVAAALSGGLLPCLEYLLRCAGRDPGGWQAAAAAELAFLGSDWVLLLAFGDAGEAAALVTTLGKVLHRGLADPRVVEGVWDPRGNLWHAVMVMVDGLVCTLNRMQDHRWDQLALRDVLEEAAPKPEAAPAACGDGGGGGGARTRGISPMTASSLLSTSLSWVPLLGPCHGQQAAHRAPAPEGAGDGEGGGCGDGADWRVALLQEAGAVPLLFVALDALAALKAAGHGSLVPPLFNHIARCVMHFAALWYTATGRDVASDAAAPSSGGASGSAVAAGKLTGSGDGDLSAGGPDARQLLASPLWRPELLWDLRAKLAAHEFPAEADVVETMAATQEADACQEWGGTSGAVQMIEPSVDSFLRRLASVMPSSPAAAPPVLLTCANPGCANLDGDSEAGLRLTPCAGCGEAAYCCRDCWAAHWRAGHRAACARRRLDAGGR